jgi:hypothetical protein
VAREPEHLRPALHQAQTELKERLDEACDEHVANESTGELIKLEELLTDAAQAAKQAISIRRRLGADHAHVASSDAAVGVDDAAAALDANAAAEPPMQGDPKPEGIREFSDTNGSLWHVWEVPAEQLAARARPGAYAGEFEDGWLAFECASGGERRRLPRYPRDWRNLSDADLDDLRGRAQTAVRRQRNARLDTNGEAGQPPG